MNYKSQERDPGKVKYWALAVLCLLREFPMHPYQMRVTVRERHKEERLGLKAGSMYHAIAWLENNQFIEPFETSRQGKRPERTVYRITAAGEKEMLRWLGELLATPAKEASSFSVALDHTIHLSPSGAAEQLEQRAARLSPRIAEMEQVLQTLAPRIGRVNVLEIEYELAMCRAELSWVQQLVGEMRSGTLTWNIEQILNYLRNAGRNRLPKQSEDGRPRLAPASQKKNKQHSNL
jgi:DNA-binding PadR family transcriptional regulator